MANACDFNCAISGLPENVDTVFKIFSNEYDSGEPCLCNIYEVYKDKEQLFDKFKAMLISGVCAWSVYSSMMPNGKYSEWSLCQRDLEYAKPYNRKFVNAKITNLVDISKDYQVSIEIIGREPIEQFSEHVIIILGKVEEDRTAKYREYDIKNTDTYEEFLELYHNSKYAIEDVDSDLFYLYKDQGYLYIPIGGFVFDNKFKI